ncbi:hypothetical protein NQ317_014809 [Molorchus minor]|uniref:Uncharacterized protein n=1 Tax=Molorchus minor TaxID=1323400 RepID=A0ABQ9JD11_9CUCU|nr:hypothetical protein NQ317_014809 [Molorchus minor]
MKQCLQMETNERAYDAIYVPGLWDTENKALIKCVILAEVQFEARGLQCAEDKIASPNGVSRMCTMNNCESEDIVEAANIAISNLLPTKSRSSYDIA